MSIRCRKCSDPVGLEVVEELEHHRVCIATGEPVAPTEADPDDFPMPVDACVQIETDRLAVDYLYQVDLQAADGTVRSTVQSNRTVSFDEETPMIGLNGPVKLYVLPNATGTIKTDLEAIEIGFDDRTTVTIGVRSLQDLPNGTITTTADPAAIARAIEAFASSIQTTSPDRSWPTMRGHPPLVELGEDLSIPPAAQAPSTDVTVRAPGELGPLFTMAPLAYYLGASVEVGGTPAVVTPTDEYPLGVDRPLESDVERSLTQVFLLDCLARSAGAYDTAATNRNAVVDGLPVDPSSVYDRSVGERFDRYAEVPYDALEPHVPRWPLRARVDSVPAGVEVLPFVLNELGLVQPLDADVGGRTPVRQTDPLVRSGSNARGAAAASVHPTPAGSDPFDTAWFGADVPEGHSRLLPEAYRNQFDRERATGETSILVVCNDPRMLEEQTSLAEIYGTRRDRPFDIHSAFGVSTADLARVFEAGGHDFVHYIGHATSEGFECHDGELDVRSLESVSVGAFFLNACSSARQGRELVRRGAFGGVCTFDEVGNDRAVRIGESVAHLLNNGFTLRGALEVTDRYVEPVEHYLLVGDGSADIVQTDGGAPIVLDVTTVAEDSYECTLASFPTKEYGVGGIVTELVTDEEQRLLHPGTLSGLTVSGAGLQEYLTWTQTPVVLDGTLYWNAEYLATEFDP